MHRQKCKNLLGFQVRTQEVVVRAQTSPLAPEVQPFAGQSCSFLFLQQEKIIFKQFWTSGRGFPGLELPSWEQLGHLHLRDLQVPTLPLPGISSGDFGLWTPLAFQGTGLEYFSQAWNNSSHGWGIWPTTIHLQTRCPPATFNACTFCVAGWLLLTNWQNATNQLADCY